MHLQYLTLEVMAMTNATNVSESAGQNEETTPAAEVTETETDNGFDSLPKSWQDEITKLRRDVAKYRTRARDAVKDEPKVETAPVEDQYKAALDSITEKHERLLVDLNEKDRVIAKMQLAVTHNVPADRVPSFVKRLQGETPEELAEDAADLIKDFHVQQDAPKPMPVDPAQGQYTALNDYDAMARAILGKHVK